MTADSPKTKSSLVMLHSDLLLPSQSKQKVGLFVFFVLFFKQLMCIFCMYVVKQGAEPVTPGESPGTPMSKSRLDPRDYGC